MFCSNCGTGNPDDAMFCFSCGAHLQQVPGQGEAWESGQEPKPEKPEPSDSATGQGMGSGPEIPEERIMEASQMSGMRKVRVPWYGRIGLIFGILGIIAALIGFWSAIIEIAAIGLGFLGLILGLIGSHRIKKAYYSLEEQDAEAELLFRSAKGFLLAVKVCCVAALLFGIAGAVLSVFLSMTLLG